MEQIRNNWIKYLFIGIFTLISYNSFAESLDNITANNDSIFRAYLAEQNIAITKNNDVQILKSGHEKFNDLFAEIEKAKHHIHLEYFNFRNDSIANKLFDLLARKAEEGVQVRALFDAFGNSSNNQPLKKKHLKEIRKRGIEIEPFDPMRFPWINHAFHRDHRKIVIIDGTIAYTGGMNIADYYINGLPEIGDWRDMHIRIKGDAVAQLQNIFLDMWNNCTKQQIEGEDYYPHSSKATYTKEVAIIDRNPKKTKKLMRRVYAKAIESANSNIQIINPYFTPTSIIKKAIKKATEKGVKVEIMISGKSDIPFSPDASMYIVNKLRKKGADIYIFNGGFHHSKIMMVDSLYCTVGSTNLNSRSLRYDYEINAFIFNSQTTEELITIFKKDQEESTLLTAEIYQNRSPWKKFIGWFAHLFTPFL